MLILPLNALAGMTQTPAACRLVRRVIDDNPRVTRFQNRFDGPEESEDEPDAAMEPEAADDDLVVNADGGGGGNDEADEGDDLQEQDGAGGNRLDEEDLEGEEAEEAEEDGKA
jgi:hypothetical protein